MALPHLLNSMAMLVLMILPGVIFKRKKIVNDDQVKSFSNVLINLVVPCLIIKSFQMEFNHEILMEVLSMGALWLVMLGVCFVFFIMLSKKMNFQGIEKGVLAAAFMVPNTGFVGIPVIEAFFGAEGLFYISVCEIISDLFVFSFVYTLINRSVGSNDKMSLKEFLNPPMIAIFLAFGMFVLNIQLPKFIGDAVSTIGAASTALAMFILGAQLEALKLKDFIGKTKLYACVFVRLILMPLVAYIVLKIILQDHSFMADIFILAWSMPVGIFTVVFCENLGEDPTLATQSIMLSNLMCLLTISVWTLIV